MEFVDGRFELREVQKLEGHTDRVWSLVWNPATGVAGIPSVFASCSGDKTVRIWEQSHPSTSWECKVRIFFSSLFLFFFFFFLKRNYYLIWSVLCLVAMKIWVISISIWRKMLVVLSLNAKRCLIHGFLVQRSLSFWLDLFWSVFRLVADKFELFQYVCAGFCGFEAVSRREILKVKTFKC